MIAAQLGFVFDETNPGFDYINLDTRFEYLEGVAATTTLIETAEEALAAAAPFGEVREYLFETAYQARVKNNQAHQTLRRWRQITEQKAAEAAEAAPIQGETIHFYQRGIHRPSFAISTDILGCKEAALLSATCTDFRTDAHLIARFTEEERKIETAKRDRKASSLLQALLEAESLSSSGSELGFNIDEDGHWTPVIHERYRNGS